MLSKEEIKHILDANVDILTYKADKDFRCLTSTEKALLKNNEKVKEYTEQLESREQKLIEKLEEINTRNAELYNSPKQKEVDFSEWNLAQELLEILKKE